MATTLAGRRDFLRVAARGIATASWPAWLPRMSFAPPQTAPRGDVLVCVFLRGAADALNVVVPHGERRYYELRPTLAIPRPDDLKAKVMGRSPVRQPCSGGSFAPPSRGPPQLSGSDCAAARRSWSRGVMHLFR